ncbi:spore cortex biosynthesis protein YabQ [Alteribacillus sp. HJP-4]|uniref:spore cortex biosynthesis protein YabQ n=1 Tax=Alteribacillus sp. HJP-4 TaxID=2775394 RepID=UPI0035CCED2B
MSLSVQFQTMIAMLTAGGLIGMNLDIYHRSTVSFVKAVWSRFVWDILFWVVQALLVFYLLLRINEGEIRIYIYPGLLAGFIVYRKYGRHKFLRGMETIFRTGQWMRRLLINTFRVFIGIPVKFVLKLLSSSVMIGLTVISKLIWFLISCLLLPMKWILQPFAPFFRRLLPESLTIRLRKAFHAVLKRVKEWWTFK